MELQDKLTDIDTTVKEDIPEYYTDMYSAWESKQQLVIWQEVADKNIKSGDINTSDSSLQTVDNVYALDVPDPQLEIFSIWINWIEKTFYIPNYWSAATAYSDLETQLSNWLWSEYIVEYDSWTTFNISRIDGTTITKTTPNLVRNIEITDWNTHTKIWVTIDWTTTTIDWGTYPSIADGIDHIISQLPLLTFYTKRDWNNLTIARIDGVIPVISKTQYNRYTTDWTGFDNVIWPTSSELWGSDGSEKAPAYKSRVTIDGVEYEYELDSWLTWSDTTYSYVWNVATYNVRNILYRASALSDEIYWTLPWTYTTSWITIDLIDGTDRNVIDFLVYKNDYTQISVTWFEIQYPIDSGLTTVNTSAYNWISTSETNHLADSTTTTYTEITITLNKTSNNYFIPTFNTPNKITIRAISSLWNSDGIYEIREQSCTAKYSSNTFKVSDKIFKTGSWDFWNIVLIKRTWFVITWTTTVSNKLSWTSE